MMRLAVHDENAVISHSSKPIANTRRALGDITNNKKPNGSTMGSLKPSGKSSGKLQVFKEVGNLLPEENLQIEGFGSGFSAGIDFSSAEYLEKSLHSIDGAQFAQISSIAALSNPVIFAEIEEKHSADNDDLGFGIEFENVTNDDDMDIEL
eukprot:comp13955_c0_seq1/m.19760 comp13955_c0_seq1/g.19760  ORF comp13955_c0_seq1/g.19760 comp13955_c0_seq1/m.19760 type:complete len:151 (-) comp13955_c0_seq1:133-585(-)